MNYFLKRTTLFLLSGILLTFMIISIAIKYFPEKFLGNQGEYLMWKYQQKKITTIKQRHFNLIIGDSRGMSDINPKLLSSNYMNLSIGGATFFEGLHTLKRVILGQNKIDTLILCYGQNHFEKSDVFNERTIPFNFINGYELNELNRIEKEVNYCISEKRIGKPSFLKLIKRHLLHIRNPFVYRSTFMDNLKNNNTSSGILSMIESLKKNNGHTLFGCADSASMQSIEADQEEFLPNPVLECYLKSIFLRANEKGMKIFIITPPISKITFENCNNNYFKDFDIYLKVLSNKYKCIIVNYTTVYNNKYFGDPSHLNKSGCVKFSKYIKQKFSSQYHL